MSMGRIVSTRSKPSEAYQELVTEELCTVHSRPNYHRRLELVLTTQHCGEASLRREGGSQLTTHQVGGSLPRQHAVRVARRELIQYMEKLRMI